MISCKTLDNELVRFDGDLKLKSLNVDEDPDVFYRFFGDIENKLGLELYVAVLICTGGKPIWGCASYGEQYDVVMGAGMRRKDDLLDEFYAANDAELQQLEMIAKYVIMPQIINLIENMQDDKMHIVDVRRMLPDECKMMGIIV